MIIVELALVTAVATLVFANFKAKSIKERDQKLLAQNTAMAESVLDSGSPFDRDESEPWYSHRWSEPTKDILYTSKLPWSYDQVVIATSVCEKCQTVHRYIVSGIELAKEKGLQSEEGFFYSGVRISSPGCPFPDRSTFVDLPEWNDFEPEWKTSCHEEQSVVSLSDGGQHVA